MEDEPAVVETRQRRRQQRAARFEQAAQFRQFGDDRRVLGKSLQERRRISDLGMLAIDLVGEHLEETATAIVINASCGNERWQIGQELTGLDGARPGPHGDIELA